MTLNIASTPRTMIEKCRAIVTEFFRGLGCLIKKGIGLGVVLFLALSTLSFLNHGTQFLENLGNVRTTQFVPQVSGHAMVQRPVGVAPTVWDRPQSRGVQMDARDTLRESGYFVGELERFTRTLSRLGK